MAMEISRRSFLKGAAATGVAFSPGRSMTSQKRETSTWWSSVRAAAA